MTGKMGVIKADGDISLCVWAPIYDSPNTPIRNFPTKATALDQNKMWPAMTNGIVLTSFVTSISCNSGLHTGRMMGMAKTVALDWNAFMKGEVRPKDQAVVLVLPAATAGALVGAAWPATVHAAVATAHIIHAFNPLIQVMQALSYPVSFLGMAAGMLLVSVGQRHRGINMVKWAAIGYIGMQLVPGIMEMVSQVGDAMK